MKRDGLMNSGIPLGGLGTGSVELRRDGLFHEWQVMNNRPWGSGPAVDAPPDSAFFAMHLEADMLGATYRRTALLAMPPEYSSRFGLLGHFLNDPYHMPWLEHPTQIDAEARFPFTTLEYTFEDPEPMPVQVTLEAFSPFIPLDASNSGLPLAFFSFTLTNRSADDFDVSLLGALRNLTGYTYLEQPSRAALLRQPAFTALRLDREGVPSGSSDEGALALAVLDGGPGEAGGENTYLFHPRSSRDIWEPFHLDGRLDSVDMGDFSGAVGNMGAERLARLRRNMPFAALCHRIMLPAGSQRTVTFALAWHFPNFIEMDYVEKKRAGQPIGHRYAADFPTIEDLLQHAAASFASLDARTRAFVDAYYQSSFPQWLLDASAAQLTTLVKSSWWDRSGRFGIWEGLGCCGLQTTDITYYGSFPILQFFPEIQRSQMRLTRENMDAPGKVPHMMPGNFSTGDVDHRGRIDLIPQYILLLWRDLLWSGDLEDARAAWPSVLDALAYFERTDTDGDGLPNNTGPDQTYDQFPLKGTSAFVGFLYAASLHAAAEMADRLGDADTAGGLRSRLRASLKALDTQLWNGEYYNLSFDSATGESNSGVMTDQINGDWFLRQSSGAGLLPERKVRQALRAVFDYCASPHGFLANCAWPFGGAVSIGRHTSDQAGTPWSGVEYAAAAHMVLMGMEKEGLQVAENVWERYERAGLRFNHIECGANYYRALSSWALYLALTGFAWDALNGSLTLAYRRRPARFVACTPSAWAEVTTGGAEHDLSLRTADGTLNLRELVLNGLRAEHAAASVDGGAIAGLEVTSAGASGVQIRFDPPLRLTAGQELRLTFD